MSTWLSAWPSWAPLSLSEKVDLFRNEISKLYTSFVSRTDIDRTSSEFNDISSSFSSLMSQSVATDPDRETFLRSATSLKRKILDFNKLIPSWTVSKVWTIWWILSLLKPIKDEYLWAWNYVRFLEWLDVSTISNEAIKVEIQWILGELDKETDISWKLDYVRWKLQRIAFLYGEYKKRKDKIESWVKWDVSSVRIETLDESWELDDVDREVIEVSKLDPDEIIEKIDSFTVRWPHEKINPDKLIEELKKSFYYEALPDEEKWYFDDKVRHLVLELEKAEEDIVSQLDEEVGDLVDQVEDFDWEPVTIIIFWEQVTFATKSMALAEIYWIKLRFENEMQSNWINIEEIVWEIIWFFPWKAIDLISYFVGTSFDISWYLAWNFWDWRGWEEKTFWWFLFVWFAFIQVNIIESMVRRSVVQVWARNRLSIPFRWRSIRFYTEDYSRRSSTNILDASWAEDRATYEEKINAIDSLITKAEEVWLTWDKKLKFDKAIASARKDITTRWITFWLKIDIASRIIDWKSVSLWHLRHILWNNSLIPNPQQWIRNRVIEWGVRTSVEIYREGASILFEWVSINWSNVEISWWETSFVSDMRNQIRSQNLPIVEEKRRLKMLQDLIDKVKWSPTIWKTTIMHRIYSIVEVWVMDSNSIEARIKAEFFSSTDITTWNRFREKVLGTWLWLKKLKGIWSILWLDIAYWSPEYRAIQFFDLVKKWLWSWDKAQLDAAIVRIRDSKAVKINSVSPTKKQVDDMVAKWRSTTESFILWKQEVLEVIDDGWKVRNVLDLDPTITTQQEIDRQRTMDSFKKLVDQNKVVWSSQRLKTLAILISEWYFPAKIEDNIDNFIEELRKVSALKTPSEILDFESNWERLWQQDIKRDVEIYKSWKLDVEWFKVRELMLVNLIELINTWSENPSILIELTKLFDSVTIRDVWYTTTQFIHQVWEILDWRDFESIKDATSTTWLNRDSIFLKLKSLFLSAFNSKLEEAKLETDPAEKLKKLKKLKEYIDKDAVKSILVWERLWTLDFDTLLRDLNSEYAKLNVSSEWIKERRETLRKLKRIIELKNLLDWSWISESASSSDISILDWKLESRLYQYKQQFIDELKVLSHKYLWFYLDQHGIESELTTLESRYTRKIEADKLAGQERLAKAKQTWQETLADATRDAAGIQADATVAAARAPLEAAEIARKRDTLKSEINKLGAILESKEMDLETWHKIERILAEISRLEWEWISIEWSDDRAQIDKAKSFLDSIKQKIVYISETGELDWKVKDLVETAEYLDSQLRSWKIHVIKKLIEMITSSAEPHKISLVQVENVLKAIIFWGSSWESFTPTSIRDINFDVYTGEDKLSDEAKDMNLSEVKSWNIQIVSEKTGKPWKTREIIFVHNRWLEEFVDSWNSYAEEYRRLNEKLKWKLWTPEEATLRSQIDALETRIKTELETNPAFNRFRVIKWYRWEVEIKWFREMIKEMKSGKFFRY